MRVLFLTRYGSLGASSRYRFYQYAPALGALGIQCEFRPLLSNDRLASSYRHGSKSLLNDSIAALTRILKFGSLRKFDLIVLQAEFLPYFPAVFERILRRMNIPYVVDFDDAIFHYYDKSGNPLIRYLLGRKIATVNRNSACVIAGNEYLAEYARRSRARRVEIIPTVIDLAKYELLTPTRSDSNEFRIGWIGSPGSSRYLAALAEPLSHLIKSGGYRLTLIGAGRDHGLDSLSPDLHAWSEATEVPEIRTFDVGVMPLPDDDWAKGKCGFKLIQYMACNKPVIASPVGSNLEIIEHGKNGFFASTAQEWVDAIRTLRENPELAIQMGTEGRKLVERRYCQQVTSERLAEIYRQCVA